MKVSFCFLFCALFVSLSVRAQDVVRLNLCEVQTREQLHAYLKTNLEFPAYYGMNWDAFIDSMSDRLLEASLTLQVEGINTLWTRLPREARLMRECLADLQERYPAQLESTFQNDECLD